MASMTPVRIVLLDDCWVQTYYLADGLRRAGCEVHLVCSRPPRTIGTWLFTSVARANPIHGEVAQLVIDRVVRRVNATHVLPMTDRLLDRYQRQPPPWHRLLLPQFGPNQAALLRNKVAMSAFVSGLGVPVPETRALDEAGDLEDAAAELGLPVVVRVVTSTAGSGVAIARDLEQLRRAVTRLGAHGERPYLQRFATGAPIISAGLFHDGRPLRYYAGEKLEIFPRDVGPATIMRSLSDAVLQDHTTRIFRELHWTGFGQIDWVRGANGTIYFLELNPRPWGAMAAGARAGVDLFSPFGTLLGGGLPEPEFQLRGGVTEYLFPQYVRAKVGREGLSGISSLVAWKHVPWHRPLLAAHLLSWVLGDVGAAVANRALRWRRPGMAFRATLPQPGPSA